MTSLRTSLWTCEDKRVTTYHLERTFSYTR